MGPGNEAVDECFCVFTALLLLSVIVNPIETEKNRENLGTRLDLAYLHYQKLSSKMEHTSKDEGSMLKNSPFMLC